MRAFNVDENDTCSQFHQHQQILWQYSFDIKLQSQAVIREKLCKTLSYKKLLVK